MRLTSVTLLSLLGIALSVTAVATTTTMTADGRLLLNGQPCFFIGTAPGPPLDLKTPEGGDGWAELAAAGLNVVRSVPGMNDANPDTMAKVKGYMDQVATHGMYVWPFLWKVVEHDDASSQAQLRQIIQTFKNHPATFFWKMTDEPAWGKKPVEPLRKSYELIKQLDPNHLCWIAHAPRGTVETLRPYNVACDVLATDIYPVSEPMGKNNAEGTNKGLSMVGDFTKRMVELSDGKKMVFMILQVFWSGVDPQHDPKNKPMWPTARQERYMTYQAIIDGANSVSYFGMTQPGQLQGKDKTVGLNWTYFRSVLKPLWAELKPGSELYPALVAPDSKYPLSFTGAPQMEVRWKEVGENLYIMAAAREGKTQKVTFSGVKDGAVSVVYENRSLQAQKGSFTDTFAEHDVHIYRVPKMQ